MSDVKPIKIDVFSDIACPYCFVGEKHLLMAKEKFLKENPNYPIDITFNTYLINSGVPEEGEKFEDYIKRKTKGDDKWTQPFKEKGKKVGCPYGNWKWFPNSIKGHALVKEAAKAKKAEEIFMDLMEATYEKGENISDEKVLNEYAEKYGIKNWNTKENIEEVHKDFEVTKNKYKMNDVPYYIFNNTIKIYGSQTPEYFDDAFEECFNQ